MNAESSLLPPGWCWLALVGVAIPLSLPASSATAEHPVRTWTDSTGQFQVRATLLGVENNHVSLLKTTGEKLQVPLLRLSVDDRRYVAVHDTRMHASPPRREAGTPSQPSPIRISQSINGSDLKGKQGESASRLEYQPLLQRMNEAELSARLAQDTPELDLYSSGETAQELIASLDMESLERDHGGKRFWRRKQAATTRHVSIRQDLLDRPELAGLPMLKRAECRLSDDECRAMKGVAAKFNAEQLRLNLRHPIVVNASLNLAPGSGHFLFSDREQERLDDRSREQVSFLRRKSKSYSGRSVPALVQILQSESCEVRRELIEILDQIDDRRACIALAKRAVFDLSSENRAAATEALRSRPSTEYRPVLIDALRFPWPPAAQHAAEALVRLDAQDAIDDLNVLLEKPSPYAPVERDGGKYAVRELVKVNHLRNCLLCHSGSTDPTHLVRGRVPYPDQRLPSQYGRSRNQSSGSFVRADMTFLRQDFSVTHPVEDHDPWPYLQRFDYLVRTRSLSPEEAALARRQNSETPNLHREAVVFALRTLANRRTEP